MFTIGIDPIIFSIGHFMVRWYSLILMIAMTVGVWLTAREAERKGFKKEQIHDAAIWIVLAGILGARLFHVLDHWSDEYAANPIRALYIWEGGLAIWGAVAGGLLAAAILSWVRGRNLAKLLDAGALGLVLAQAIGRIACIITGDAVGKPTTGPFGFAYTSTQWYQNWASTTLPCQSMNWSSIWAYSPCSGNCANAICPMVCCS